MEKPTGEASPWRVLETRRVYDNPWIGVREHSVVNPSGKPGIYGTVHFKNLAIGIVPLDSSGFTWLVRQYRFPLSEYSWEIPEGGGPLDLDPLDSAKRELREETGLVAERWDLIQQVHLSNSVSDEKGLLYLARGLSQGPSAPEETELLEVRKLSLGEAWAMVEAGDITDSLSVIGLSAVRWGVGREYVDGR